MKSSDVYFDHIKDAISEFSALIKKFVEMLKAFVDSWKKVPAAAADPTPVEEPDYEG